VGAIMIDELTRPLTANEIEFRVQSISKKGYATILAYKDARADMIRLDNAVSPLGWKREHINGNANCIVSIWNDDIKQWISKEDTGTESMAAAKKGLASDSFKRACFNWGIGRELYDYPFICIKLNDDEWNGNTNKPKQSWGLKIKDWSWYNEFDENGHLSFLAGKDNKGKVRFKFGKMRPKVKITLDMSKQFINCVQNHLALQLYILKESTDKHGDQWGQLIGLIKDDITNVKKTITALVNEGHNIFDNCLSEWVEADKKQDESYKKQLESEMPPEAVEMLHTRREALGL
jgi:hypothetical protein